MKIDMHCHVKEGSIDSKVGLEEYITILKKHGFQGMVITDHDTYNGYRYWKNNIKGKKHTDFVVLKGIEYDTRDAGGSKNPSSRDEGDAAGAADRSGAPQRRRAGTCTSVWGEVYEFYKCQEILSVPGNREAV